LNFLVNREVVLKLLYSFCAVLLALLIYLYVEMKKNCLRSGFMLNYMPEIIATLCCYVQRQLVPVSYAMIFIFVAV